MNRCHRRRLVVWATLLCAFALPLLAQPEPQTAREWFEAGNLAYQAGQYAEAVEAYSRLTATHNDPRVEFNLGNAQFRLGNLGLSILHFERARRLDPVDPEIRANLEYARSFCFNRVERMEMPTLLRWIVELQDRLGPDVQLLALIVLSWVTATWLVWSLIRPGRWSATYGWSLAVLLLAVFIVAISWYATIERVEGRSLAVVLQDSVEVLAGPGSNNPALATIHEGLTLDVLERNDQGWIKVSLPNGLNGWLDDNAVGLVE